MKNSPNRIIPLLLFGFCIFFSFPSYAQKAKTNETEEKYRNFGLEIPFYYSVSPLTSVPFNPTITYRQENSKWHLGAVVGKRQWLAGIHHHYIQFGNFNINGITMGHSYYPNVPLGNFRLSIRTDFYWGHLSDEVMYPVYEGETIQKVTSLSLTTGYQIQFNFFRHFYLFHNLGFGIMGLQEKFEFPDSSKTMIKRGMVNMDFCFRLGLGVQIKKIIKH